jgi:hypothetical protein
MELHGGCLKSRLWGFSTATPQQQALFSLFPIGTITPGVAVGRFYFGIDRIQNRAENIAPAWTK